MRRSRTPIFSTSPANAKGGNHPADRIMLAIPPRQASWSIAVASARSRGCRYPTFLGPQARPSTLNHSVRHRIVFWRIFSGSKVIMLGGLPVYLTSCTGPMLASSVFKEKRVMTQVLAISAAIVAVMTILALVKPRSNARWETAHRHNTAPGCAIKRVTAGAGTT